MAYRRVGRGGEYLVGTRRVDIERLSCMAEIRRARPTRREAYIHTFIHTYIVHTYMQTYIHTLLIHTYIHLYIHTYSLIRQIGRLKLNNSSSANQPPPNRSGTNNTTSGSDVNSGTTATSNSNPNKVVQEDLLIEDLKSSSGKMW